MPVCASMSWALTRMRFPLFWTLPSTVGAFEEDCRRAAVVLSARGWDGSPAILQSRAWDEAGNAQPTRAQFIAQRGELKKAPPIFTFPNQHYNAVTSWGVDARGEVKHVYA
jgi:hypothetical protein